ncbi:MAG: putative ABC transport system permease protein [Roseivirga sp.]
MKQHNISPPKWAIKFLHLFCKEEYLDEIEGDLFEIFERVAHKRGRSRAKIGFIWNTIRFFKWSNIKQTTRFNSNIVTMTSNNLKIAARVLWRQKANTLLNVAGISIGMACFLLISLYVKREVSYDKFHENGDRIYRTWTLEDYGGDQTFFYTNSPLPLEKALEDNIPDIEMAVQYNHNSFLVGEENVRLNERVAVASPGFFNMFSFPMVKGKKENPLQDKTSIVISEDFAIKYFGEEESVGQLITIQIQGQDKMFTVSAIMKNLPRNSGFRFDLMISNQNNDILYHPDALQAWFNVTPETYVLIKENSSIGAVEAKLPEMIKTVLGDRIEDGQYKMGLQPLFDIHLNPEFPLSYMPVSNPKYVYVLGAIGFLVLLIACINYTTLSVGQSMKRAKEVGVRKVVGAQRAGLVWQYISESLLVSLIAMLIGLAVAYLLVPVFNELANTDLVMPFDFSTLSVYLLMALIIGLATGAYPAFVLSNLKLINVLRGTETSVKGSNWIRKSLLVFQLLLTVFLISSTLIMKKQLNFIQNQDLGFNREAMVSVPMYADKDARGMNEMLASGFKNGQLLKEQLQANPSVSNIAMGSHVFGANGWMRLGFNDKNDNFKQFNLLVVDPFYVPSFGIEIKEGRNFDPALDLDKRESIILNQAAVDYFGLTNPIGKSLPGDEFKNHTIIGVTDNFNFESLHAEVRPLVITQNDEIIIAGVSDFNVNDSPIPKLIFKFNGASLLDVKSLLEGAWSAVFPNQELRFDFVNEKLRLQYQEEGRVNKIIGIATALSITIASLGLLGLTILMVNSKVKEIGIRKILGASPSTIFGMLFKDLSVQLLIAIALSVPITLYLMRLWLADFAYRVNIGVDMFLFSGILAFGLTLLVISYYAIRAANSNPVKALRAE